MRDCIQTMQTYYVFQVIFICYCFKCFVLLEAVLLYYFALSFCLHYKRNVTQ